MISEQNEHPYFHKPQSITKQTLDYIRFDPLLITENDLFADNRPYHYEQNSQDQQYLHFNTNNSMKMITPIRKIQPNNKINLKTITIMSLLPKNLQFQHIIHHKQGHQHQYILNLLEFPLEL